MEQQYVGCRGNVLFTLKCASGISKRIARQKSGMDTSAHPLLFKKLIKRDHNPPFEVWKFTAGSPG